MPVSEIKQEKYILGQSIAKSIKDLGEEIRLDLSLQPNPNLNAGTVIGTVKDENGNPIDHALIKIMDSNHNPLAHAFTGLDGAYIFSPFPPGTDYHIYATKQGYALAENLPFTLLPNQTIRKDFTLVVDPNASLGIIAGDVTNKITHAPVKGAVVNLYSVDEFGVETLYAVAFTNEYGQFVFSELPLGNYIVRVNALGYKPYATTVLISAPGQIAHVISDLNVDQESSRGTISGIITETNNQPIPFADVTLYRVEADNSLTPIAFTKTNDEGVYLFINVPQGNYKIKSNKIFISQSV